MLVTYLVLLLALIAIATFIYRDIKHYPHFKTLTKTEDRQKQFREWVLLSFAVFGIGGLLGLWAIGHINAVFEMPELIRLNLTPDTEASALSRFLKGLGSVFVYVIIIAIALGPLIHALMQRITASQNAEDNTPPVVGDVEPIMPRNKKEQFWSFWIAVNAGFSEEIFFRLLLFIVLTLLSGNVWVGILGSTVLFGITHYYQGWGGVIGTTFIGGIFMMLYLVTQQIWVPIVLHMILDINALLVTPWLSRLNGSKT